mmetsp:Transcript_54364/g.157874  ORF Transcript_54364/g.157874 Transcript_54364/m.157874 type:complete len:202 (-) Transcript_54364:55-660(-)
MGVHERMTKFSETETSDKLKLFKPMFTANVKENTRIAPHSDAVFNGAGSQCRWGKALRKRGRAGTTSARTKTCCTAVTRNGAGTPYSPSSSETAASDSMIFMYKLRPLCIPKYASNKPSVLCFISSAMPPRTSAQPGMIAFMSNGGDPAPAPLRVPRCLMCAEWRGSITVSTEACKGSWCAGAAALDVDAGSRRPTKSWAG